MIAFIIPLKSKAVSKNWTFTSNLLKNTLTSILKQSCQDFIINIIGHEEPDIGELSLNKKISFVKSSFALELKNGKTAIESYLDIDRILDKLQKINIGLFEASKHSPEYYMVLDADDILHKDFVKFILTEKDPNGYIVKKGYEYYSGNSKVVKEERLDKICGSTTVVHKQHILTPEPKDEYSFIPILWNKLSHADMDFYFNEQRTPLKEIPFYSVLYILNHGQNASDEFRGKTIAKLKVLLKILILGQKVDRRIKEAFSLID